MKILLNEKIDHNELIDNIQEFYSYAKKKLNLDKSPKLFFKVDQKNADNILGKTGYYDTSCEGIYLYITDRHPKDIIRSFAHELIHHQQKINGMFDDTDTSITVSDPSYALHDKKLRMMEKDAFKRGNMLFRDWTDIKKMEIKNMLNEKSGKMPMKTDKKDVDNDGNKTEKVPAFLDKGDVKKKKGTGKVPPQLAKAMKKKPTSEMKVHLGAKEQVEEAKKQFSVNDIREMLSNAFSQGTDKDRKRAFINVLKEIGLDDETIEGFVKVAKNYTNDFRKVIKDSEYVDKLAPYLEKKISAIHSKEQSDEEQPSVPKYADVEVLKSKLQADLDQYARNAEQRKAAETLARLQKLLDKAAKGELISNPETGEVYGPPEGALPEELNLQENKTNPYPTLFERKERLLNKAFETKEERVYNELVRRFIKK